MRYINLFYIVLLLLGISLYFLWTDSNHNQVLSFYGFAESNETEVNYNYPVVVKEILVKPGQEVSAGQNLLKLARVQSKEQLADHSFRISKLESEALLWTNARDNEIKKIDNEYDISRSALLNKINSLEKELAYKKSLVKDLKSINTQQVIYDPITDEIKELNESLSQLDKTYSLKSSAVKQELKLGKNPFAQQIQKVKAEVVFDESLKEREIIVSAPSDGLIGNIFCKEAEHIPSYKTLLSFYEPHSNVVRGFVHEDLTLKVKMETKFKVSSLKDAGIVYEGHVIGLGSRIIEIPVRLRKMPDLKTYGREILVEIPKSNTFLQKEKVALSYVNGH